jgi:hypothetical protein
MLYSEEASSSCDWESSALLLVRTSELYMEISSMCDADAEDRKLDSEPLRE